MGDIVTEQTCKERMSSAHREVIDALSRIAEQNAEIKALVTATNGRVRVLELWKSRMLTIIGTLAAIYGGPDLITKIVKALAAVGGP